MSYTVLARKWRPRTFAQMVGQEHVLRALVNALDADRLHHAFLFAGTRGVGKTTVARILAKCLNCESGMTSTPCDKCSACEEIDEGRFVDLIEVDAASRTKVDDTRELLDNVQYTPTRGRFKVYLIDEVHMLSRHSFNALLKTLEEPPPHVKFLLATTDPQRLPVTVLSRCLQFNLKRLTLDLIGGQLRRICEAESFDNDEEALTLLARAADGSMRDGLSLLDQAVAFGGGSVRRDDVLTMLGTVDRRQVFKVLEKLALGDAKQLMDVVAQMDAFSPDYEGVLADMASLLQRAAMVSAVPDSIGEETLDGDAIRKVAASMSPEDLQLYYQIGITGRRDLALAPDPRAGFEMTLLRMLAFRPAGAGDRAPMAAATAPQSKPSLSGQSQAPPSTSTESAPTSAAEPAPPASATPPVVAGACDWHTLFDALPVQGAARNLAANCLLGAINGSRVALTLDPEHEHLMTPAQRERLAAAFSTHLGVDATLSIEVEPLTGETPAQRDSRMESASNAAAIASIENDPNVQAFKEAFGATVESQSVKRLDS
ncbi:MAG: DNA polymerase III subunit gamma/tau [Gammaproteobacteria bacterium]